jgi:hypothetical protein
VRSGAGFERALFGLDRPAAADVGPPGIALRDEPASAAHRPGRGEQVVRPGGAQLVGLREGLVEIAQAARRGQRGQLVDDHVRLRAGDRLTDRRGVETVGHHRLGAKPAPQILLGRATGRPHVMAARDKLGHQLAAHRPSGARDEHSHDRILSLIGKHRLAQETVSRPVL